jgi:hypothetical protein
MRRNKEKLRIVEISEVQVTECVFQNYSLTVQTEYSKALLLLFSTEPNQKTKD